MSIEYIRALYNPYRNAVPSWQGYHYQAQTAVYYFLKYILSEFKKGNNILENVKLEIEWLEDFIIFDNQEIKIIYQAKKTLKEKERTEVLENFLIQFNMASDKEINWVIVYDDIKDDIPTNIDKDEYVELFDKCMNKKLKAQIELLLENIDNEKYCEDNLKLRDSESNKSELRDIRHFVSKLVKNDKVKNHKEQFEKIIEQIDLNAMSFLKFKNSVLFERILISAICGDSIDIIKELITGEYLEKSEILSENEILDILINKVYEKLMDIKNKNKQQLILSFNDVKNIFVSKEKEEFHWDIFITQVKKTVDRDIDVYCTDCSDKSKCDKCILATARSINFYECKDNLNLEYPKSDSNIILSLRNKLSDPKIHSLIATLNQYRDYDNCNISYFGDNGMLEIETIVRKYFISMLIDDNDNPQLKTDLISNITSHIEVYNEYDYILTKSYDDIIDYEDIKLIKENMEGKYKPKFIDIAPINFKSKKLLEEDIHENTTR